MTKVAFLRIDDRLVHGQVIVGWLPEIKPESLVVVDDNVAEDAMRQDLMSLSVPPEIELSFYSSAEVSAAVVSSSGTVSSLSSVVSAADVSAVLLSVVAAESPQDVMAAAANARQTRYASFFFIFIHSFP